MKNTINTYAEYRNGIKIAEFDATQNEVWQAAKNYFVNTSSNVVHFDDAEFKGLCEECEYDVEQQDWYLGEGLYEFKGRQNGNDLYELVMSADDEQIKHDALTIIKVD